MADMATEPHNRSLIKIIFKTAPSGINKRLPRLFLVQCDPETKIWSRQISKPERTSGTVLLGLAFILTTNEEAQAYGVTLQPRGQTDAVSFIHALSGV
jgi:hypothetical protein